MNAQQVSELRNAHVMIVGLGLMGGSLALALRPYVRKITAVEVDASTRHTALEKGIVDVAAPEMEQHLAGANLVVLATPVRSIVTSIGELQQRQTQACTVLDLGSTKTDICAAMDTLPARFAAIGGHPMCGKESSGLQLAERDLYRDQTFVLCRTRRTTERAEQLVLSLLAVIGAQPMFLSPHDHDRLVAQVSHLPYFLASLLMQQTARAADGDKNVWTMSASGFRDTSRLSGSEPRMFLDIVATNRLEILRVLRRHAIDLEALIELIEKNDEARLREWLQTRREEFHAYRRAA